MMRQRLRARFGDAGGFTLIELLVVMAVIAILAAIAFVVFLNQADKGRDASAQSNVNNLAHHVQASNAGRVAVDEFRACDSAAEVGPTALAVSPLPAAARAGGDCT